MPRLKRQTDNIAYLWVLFQILSFAAQKHVFVERRAIYLHRPDSQNGKGLVIRRVGDEGAITDGCYTSEP